MAKCHGYGASCALSRQCSERQNPKDRVRASNIGRTHLVGDGGRGPEGQLWQYCHAVEDAAATRSLWQYCHNAPEAPARHPRLELSTTVDPIPEIPGRTLFLEETSEAASSHGAR